MKTNQILLICFIVLQLMCYGCSKEESHEERHQDSTLNLNIENITYETKSMFINSDGLPSKDQDNKINQLEVFIFHSTPGASNDGKLDTYKKYTSTEINTGSGYSINTTTGKKDIYVIANSHKENWQSITSVTEFKNIICDLKDENYGDFTMTSYSCINLGISTTLNITLQRLVSRIEVSSIKTSFKETPYEGKTLTDAKLYMTNVSNIKRVHDGSTPSPFSYLNHKKIIATDINGCLMDGIIYDQISGNIGEDSNEYKKTHLFHAYENIIHSENSSQSFTRLILEAKLDGVTYYYPININRPGFGYTKGSEGIVRNNWYKLSITILRPGSLDPDTVLERANIEVSVSVMEWDKIEMGNQAF